MHGRAREEGLDVKLFGGPGILMLSTGGMAICPDIRGTFVWQVIWRRRIPVEAAWM